MKRSSLILIFLLFSLTRLSAQPESTTVNFSYTLNLSFHYLPVQQAVNQALFRQGIDPHKVEFIYASHYEAENVAAENEINISGRQKGEDFVLWIADLPILIFYNKKTLGPLLNVDKAFLEQAIESAICEQPFTYKNISLDRPIKICAGAVSGLSRRALALYTGYPYSKVKKLGEDAFFALHPLTHVQDRIIGDVRNTYDLICVPLPVQNISLHIQETDLIGIAAVEGKHFANPTYPLVSTVLMGSFSSVNAEHKQRMMSALHDSKVKESLKSIGFRFPSGNLDAFFQNLINRRPDLFGAHIVFENPKQLPVLPPVR